VPSSSSAWTSERIQSLRHALQESTDAFGQRFFRSGRTVEDWEQGRSRPNAQIQRALDELERKVRSKRTK
jgi:DNA-binding transcriptional regulator YiaG